MNVLHIKYAVEIDRAGSITRAAEHLQLSQPNLSKAMRDLEQTLGFSVFKRSSKGVVPTKAGEEFLRQARAVSTQLGEMERHYERKHTAVQQLSLSMPRASYIAHACSTFVNQLDRSMPLEVSLCETNSAQTIRHVVEGEFSLGIIRFRTEHAPYFLSLLAEKQLQVKPLLYYHQCVLFAQDHPLAAATCIEQSALKDYTQIIQGDLAVPFLPARLRRDELHHKSEQYIRIYDRSSQFDLLRQVQDTFMLVSPIPQALLDCYGLVQCPCTPQGPLYQDVIIHSHLYHLSSLDHLFLQQLYWVRDEIAGPEHHAQQA